MATPCSHWIARSPARNWLRGRPLNESLDSMQEAPEYTHRAIAFGRIYFIALGLALVAIGVLCVMSFEAPLNWAGGILAAAGLMTLLYSASKPGRNVAHSARTIVEEMDE